MSKKILVLEDDAGISQALKLTLEFEGYSVIVLEHPKQLIKIIKKEKPDLILLDLLLGNVSGQHIAEVLKKDPESQNIPVVLMSAHVTASRISKKLRLEGFLAKPFEIQTLLDLVKRLLHNRN